MKADEKEEIIKKIDEMIRKSRSAECKKTNCPSYTTTLQGNCKYFTNTKECEEYVGYKKGYKAALAQIKSMLEER